MSSRWVVNTSPLILLERIDSLGILTALCEELVVPKAVEDELLSYEGDRYVWAGFFRSSTIVRPIEAPLEVPPDIAGWGLGRGESEVVAYAMAHAGFEAVLDDREARKCAATFKIPLRGTVGIILLAKKKHVIPTARPLVEDLKRAGLRFHDDWIDRALRLVGEDT